MAVCIDIVQLLIEKDHEPPAGTPDSHEPYSSGGSLRHREELWPSASADPERFDYRGLLTRPLDLCLNADACL
jgi:hypothetical protein